MLSRPSLTVKPDTEEENKLEMTRLLFRGIGERYPVGVSNPLIFRMR